MYWIWLMVTSRNLLDRGLVLVAKGTRLSMVWTEIVRNYTNWLKLGLFCTAWMLQNIKLWNMWLIIKHENVPTYTQSSVWGQTAECHDVQPTLIVGLIFSTTYRTHHNVIEISWNTQSSPFKIPQWFHVSYHCFTYITEPGGRVYRGGGGGELQTIYT